MKKWVCTVCGYVCEGEAAPEKCPICKAPASKFQEMSGEKVYADEHKIGVAKGRQADREGYPEVAEAYKRYALEEAEHASKFAELLGEVVTADTKKNLEMRADAEYGACDGKLKLAKLAKELGYDAIHDTVHEMCKDEARHGRGFDGLLKRYFGK